MARDFLCNNTDTVATTTAGKVKGYRLDGIYTFHGIKYANAKRFQMPEPVKPWEGIREAVKYGHICHTLDSDNSLNEMLITHRYWYKSDDCQYVNVWTKSLSPQAKKPVMVWIHGGGFSTGSSVESVTYEGDQMCQHGDVVVVTLNHRLNILGYLDLSPFGEKYRNSGNAGQADIVAALEWIRDNIANFGGDPDNVTIFGQSGGGMKVTSLLQTPQANGLFHKAIIQSGTIFPGSILSSNGGDGTMIVTAMLKDLGLDLSQVSQLETIPYHQLAEAYKKVRDTVQTAGGYTGCAPFPNDFYVGDPLEVGFTEHAGTIPVLIGSVMAEFPIVEGYKNTNSQEVSQQLLEQFGPRVPELIAQYQLAYPGKDLSYLTVADTLFRPAIQKYIALRAQTCSAPTYAYMMTFEFPVDDGKAPWHCAELPYIFHNSVRVAVSNVPGVSDRLEAQMFGSWMGMAHKGSPGNDLLPQWPPCVPETEYTMIFDRECRVVENFDHAFLPVLMELAPAFNPVKIKNNA